ncbi:MAG: hypothetical protein N2645_21060 [Clostridia bacterium]|nr:hypothetical protein [Clostridia bacterium]
MMVFTKRTLLKLNIILLCLIVLFVALVLNELIQPVKALTIFNPVSLFIKKDELPPDQCRNIVMQMKNLQKKTFVPKDSSELRSLKAAFDINEYFSVLDRLTLEKGWKLDYYYYEDSLGSYPIIFAQNKPYDLDEMYRNFKGFNQPKTIKPIPDFINANDYINHIKTDGSKMAFFQFAVLDTLADCFSLDWHAYYFEKDILCTKDSIRDIYDKTFLKISIEDLEKIDVSPVVKFEKEDVLVRLFTFSSWKGLVEKEYHIAKKFPHKIISVKDNILVKNDYMVVF